MLEGAHTLCGGIRDPEGVHSHSHSRVPFRRVVAIRYFESRCTMYICTVC